MYPFSNIFIYGKRTSFTWWIRNSRRNRALKTWTGSRGKCSSKCFQRVSSQPRSSCVSSLRCCCWSRTRIPRTYRARRSDTFSIKNKSPKWGFFYSAALFFQNSSTIFAKVSEKSCMKTIPHSSFGFLLCIIGQPRAYIFSVAPSSKWAFTKRTKSIIHCFMRRVPSGVISKNSLL